MSVAVETSDSCLGWRRVERVAPDGSTTWEEVPLELEDLMAPQEGDRLLQTLLHAMFCVYLWNAIRARVANVPLAVVLLGGRISWEAPVGETGEAFGPDLALLFGVEHDETKGTLELGPGLVPDLVMEVTSKETRQQDLFDKRVLYHDLKVPRYVIVDAAAPRGEVRLIGLRWEPEGYVEEELDEQGRLWLPSVNLWLGVEGQQLVCFDGTTGERFGDYSETLRSSQAANARIAALKTALQLAEQTGARMAELLEAERKKNQADLADLVAERQRAEAERKKVRAELQRIDKERKKVRGDFDAERIKVQADLDVERQRGDDKRQKHQADLDAERQRIDEARKKAQADFDKARADSDAERQCADDLEKRVVELEARLDALTKPG